MTTADYRSAAQELRHTRVLMIAHRHRFDTRHDIPLTFHHLLFFRDNMIDIRRVTLDFSGYYNHLIKQ